MRKSGFMTCVIQIYCESRSCDARESTIITSDKKAWRCPTCGAPAKVRRRLSLAAYQEQLNQDDARIRRLRHWR
jgi:hypothetical protein